MMYTQNFSHRYLWTETLANFSSLDFTYWSPTHHLFYSTLLISLTWLHILHMWGSMYLLFLPENIIFLLFLDWVFPQVPMIGPWGLSIQNKIFFVNYEHNAWLKWFSTLSVKWFSTLSVCLFLCTWARREIQGMHKSITQGPSMSVTVSRYWRTYNKTEAW